MTRWRLVWGLGMLLIVPAGVGCGCAGRTDSAPCPEGSERCPCYGNQTCDEGLICASGICVSVGEDEGAGAEEAGSGGQGGTPAPPCRGASYFQVVSDGCNVSAATGFAIPEGQQPTTQTDQGPRVEDERNGAEVSCEVSPSGDGYFISGTLRQDTRSFTVSGSVAPTEDGHAGLGTIMMVDSPQSFDVRSDPDLCQLTVNANQDIAPGRVWGNFSCVRAANPPHIECDAMGSFVLENCQK